MTNYEDERLHHGSLLLRLSLWRSSPIPASLALLAWRLTRFILTNAPEII
jgi:hypothetical protein